MRTALPLLVLLAACGPTEEPVGKRWYADDYAPTFGDRLSYADPTVTATDADGLHLFVANGSWEFRTGADYDTGTTVADLDVDLDDDGLWVDGMLVMPGAFVEGDGFDNGTVDVIGERKIAIGTYSEIVQITVDEGRLAGEIGFVIGVGPVIVTLDGVTWEESVKVEQP